MKLLKGYGIELNYVYIGARTRGACAGEAASACTSAGVVRERDAEAGGGADRCRRFATPGPYAGLRRRT